MAETETPVPVAETPAEEPKPTSEPETKIEEASPADPPQPMEEDAPAAPAPAEEAAKPAPVQPAAEESAPAPEEPKQLPVRQYLESTGVWSGCVVGDGLVRWNAHGFKVGWLAACRSLRVPDPGP